MCLSILLFLNNRYAVNLCEWEGWGWGVKKLVIFCGCHDCMITNVKKVMALVTSLVSVLQ